MSKLIDQGGPAFPMHHVRDIPVGMVSEYERLCSGMSLRDYFAAKAMAAFIGNNDRGLIDMPWVAEGAYKIADAMLRARGAQ